MFRRLAPGQPEHFPKLLDQLAFVAIQMVERVIGSDEVTEGEQLRVQSFNTSSADTIFSGIPLLEETGANGHDHGDGAQTTGGKRDPGSPGGPAAERQLITQ